jgi:hypothetical protein
MPLPPLDPNNTQRYFVDYTANGHEHTAVFRYSVGAAPGAPSAAQIDKVELFLDAIAPLMPTDFAIVGAYYTLAGSNITQVWLAPVLTVAGTYTPKAGDAASMYSFTGRSADGRKSRISMIGVGYGNDEITTGNKWRLTGADKTEIADALAILDGSNFLAIGGQIAAWHDYANVGVHRYWQDELRG